MRRLCLYSAASLDGYIARPDGSLDWLPPPRSADGDYGYAEFMGRIDTIVMGRKTYDKALELGGPVQFDGRRCLVFSRQRAGQKDAQVEFPRGEPDAILRRLKRQRGRDIWLVGGGEILRLCLDAGLVDEIILTIIPVLLGNGLPLFPPGRESGLTLTASRAFSGGLLQLTYAVSPGLR